jgi:hypothetical protein
MCFIGHDIHGWLLMCVSCHSGQWVDGVCETCYCLRQGIVARVTMECHSNKNLRLRCHLLQILPRRMGQFSSLKFWHLSAKLHIATSHRYLNPSVCLLTLQSHLWITIYFSIFCWNIICLCSLWCKFSVCSRILLSQGRRGKLTGKYALLWELELQLHYLIGRATVKVVYLKIHCMYVSTSPRLVCLCPLLSSFYLCLLTENIFSLIMVLCETQGANRTLLHWLKLWDKVVFNRERKVKRKVKVESKKGECSLVGSLLYCMSVFVWLAVCTASCLIACQFFYGLQCELHLM